MDNSFEKNELLLLLFIAVSLITVWIAFIPYQFDLYRQDPLGSFSDVSSGAPVYIKENIVFFTPVCAIVICLYMMLFVSKRIKNNGVLISVIILHIIRAIIAYLNHIDVLGLRSEDVSDRFRHFIKTEYRIPVLCIDILLWFAIFIILIMMIIHNIRNYNDKRKTE